MIYDLDVPDFNKNPLNMSGLALTSTSGWLLPTTYKKHKKEEQKEEQQEEHRQENYKDVDDDDCSMKQCFYLGICYDEQPAEYVDGYTIGHR